MRSTQIEICQALLSDHSVSEKLISIFNGNAQNVRTRFHIYKNSSVGALQKVLSTIYPVCKNLVGEDFFGYLSQQYILQYPLKTPLVTYYGEFFSEFIRAFPAANSVPYLADMATYEWHWHCVFHGPDHLSVDFPLLTQMITAQGDQIILRLVEGAVLMTSVYRLDHIWHVCQPEYTGAYTVDFSDETRYFVFWQQVHQVRVRVITAAEFAILELLKMPRTLLDLCETTTMPTHEILPRLYREGCVKITTPSQAP